MEMAVMEEQSMDKGVLAEVLFARQRKNITEDLEEFVWDAYKDGGISSREAEQILHPLHAHIARCLKKISSLTDGDVKEVKACSKSMFNSRTNRRAQRTESLGRAANKFTGAGGDGAASIRSRRRPSLATTLEGTAEEVHGEPVVPLDPLLETPAYADAQPVTPTMQAVLTPGGAERPAATSPPPDGDPILLNIPGAVEATSPVAFQAARER